MIERKDFDAFVKQCVMGGEKVALVEWDGLIRSGSLKVGDGFILCPTERALCCSKDGRYQQIVVATTHTTPRLARLFAKQITRWGRLSTDADPIDLTEDSEVAKFVDDRGFADLCTIGETDETKRCIIVESFVDYVKQVYHNGEPTDKWERKKQPIFKWGAIDDEKYESVVKMCK